MGLIEASITKLNLYVGLKHNRRSWFDKLTTNGLLQIPFALSLSKGVYVCLRPVKNRLTVYEPLKLESLISKD